jgi:ABC-type Fe3+-hydroxamate transport system substrate-binding protein
MFSFTDQTGRAISLTHEPRRIISLVPSQTELLFDLGLREEVVGITKFCVHPDEWFRTKTRVGGTKQLKLEIIQQLQPDLIIANKEENVKEQVEELARQYPVWISDINTLDDAYEMIDQIGLITKKEANATMIINRIRESFDSFKIPTPPLRAAYFIWRNPYMTVGADTFIHYMMHVAGFINVYGDETRYPEIDVQALKTKNPGIFLLSSEPFPFKQAHVDELQTEFPETKILLVDGEMFSWYGSRLMYAAGYFRRLSQILTNS